MNIRKTTAFRKFALLLTPITASVFLPRNAFAHAVVFTGNSFVGGFFHSFTGLDHALAMLGVGFLSTRLKRGDILLLPLCFLIFLAVGASAGYSGFRFAYSETVVALSCFVLGSCIFLTVLQSYRVAIFIFVAIFGFVHGYVHLVELPAKADAILFTFGFLSASTIMHLTGVFLGEVFKDAEYLWLIRLFSVAMCLFGTLFTLRSISDRFVF